MLTYHEILHRYNLAAAHTYTPSTDVLLRDINYLLTLIDRYNRIIRTATQHQHTHA